MTLVANLPLLSLLIQVVNENLQKDVTTDGKFAACVVDSGVRQETSGFFHESDSPGPLSIPLGPFQIFTKIGNIGK